MATELTMLAWSTVLGFVYIFATSTVVTRERGMKWNASARDGDAKPVSALAGRLQRAQANFLETFPFFAAAAIAVVVASRGNDTTALAAQAYFWARVVYLPCTPQACSRAQPGVAGVAAVDPGAGVRTSVSRPDPYQGRSGARRYAGAD